MKYEDDGEIETSPLGFTKRIVYIDGERTVITEDPGWDYVYDEDDMGVTCPCCGEELRYNNGCCCLECESTFTDSEITDWAGPWHL